MKDRRRKRRQGGHNVTDRYDRDNSNNIHFRGTIQTPGGEFTIIYSTYYKKEQCPQGFKVYRRFKLEGCPMRDSLLTQSQLFDMLMSRTPDVDITILHVMYKKETGVLLHAISVNELYLGPDTDNLHTCKFIQFPEDPKHITTCKCSRGRVISTTFRRIR